MNKTEIDKTIEAVAEEFGLLPSDLSLRTRRREIVEARDMAVTLLYEGGCPSSTMARILGLTRTAAISARNRFYDRTRIERGLRQRYLRLKGHDTLTLSEYQDGCLRYTDKACSDPAYLALAMCGESGEAADKVRKIIRDHDREYSETDRKAVALELGDVLWYLVVLADRIGYSFSEIARMNMSKVRDRYERGTIHGKGDER